MTEERDIREVAAAVETAKAQLEGLIRQRELIQMAVEEHVRARETIKNLLDSKPGDEVLIPVGADSYVHAKVSEKRDAVVGVGSGVSIQRGAEDAEKILQGRIDDLSQAFQKVSERANQLEGFVQEMTAKLQEQYEALQRGEGA
ncbi:MAG: prefoldin subunit alpha [Thermoplasmata archaeon]|nr:prefoldin subunit alpha [Thermoplasmata archaeon]